AAEEEEQREGVTNEAFHGSLQEWVRRSAGGRRPARETREQGHQHWGRARIALRLLPGVASHHGGTSRVPPRGAAVCGARARSRVCAPALPLLRKGRSACRRSSYTARSELDLVAQHGQREPLPHLLDGTAGEVVVEHGVLGGEGVLELERP